MKKALVLGVLAFFAINIATVQNAHAQDKKRVATTQTTDVTIEKADNSQATQDARRAALKAARRSMVKTETRTATKEVKVQPESTVDQDNSTRTAQPESTVDQDNSRRTAQPATNRSIPPTRKTKAIRHHVDGNTTNPSR